MAKDPICGMDVDPANAAGSYEYEGETYYFCSTHCLEKFKSDPAKYAGAPPEPMTHEHHVHDEHSDAGCPPGYACPIHPGEKHDAPGSCNI